MNMQPTPMDEQITGEDLVVLSLEELEELFLTIYAALEKIFHAVSSYAQGGMPIEAQKLAVIGLENQFKWMWPDLKATVDAIIYHAVFAEQDEQRCNKLAEVVRGQMKLVQVVTSGLDIPTEWLVKRDALAVQDLKILDDVQIESL